MGGSQAPGPNHECSCRCRYALQVMLALHHTVATEERRGVAGERQASYL